jgi:lysozyme
MTYDPRQTFQAKQSAFGRASGVTSSKPAVSGGRGSIVEKPGERAAALKKQRDKLVKSQFDQFRRRERNVGLGSRPDTKRRDDDKPQKNFLENLFDRVKSSIIFAGGDPERKRRPDPNPGALYTASPFILPAVTAVATTTLGPAPVGADATGMPSIYTPDTREFGTGIQPMEAPEKPESAKIDIFDPFREKIQRSTAPSGLMSPPQPKDLATTPDMADAINRTIASVTSADPDVPYVIQAGDTLSEIAAKTGTTVDDLQELNAIEDIDVIKTGEQLKIPSARSTKTKEDIVSSIVGDYVKKTGDVEGVEVAALGPGVMGSGLMSKLFGEPDIEKAIIERLKVEEGFEEGAYKPVGTEKYYTIGYGHYGKDVKAGDTITKAEAEKLLEKDVKKRLPKIKKAIPNFNNLSPELQVEIAQSWFRGGIAGSPKTIKLINKGEWTKASEEFLDNEEYRDEDTLPGVKRRMEGLSLALQEEQFK